MIFENAAELRDRIESLTGRPLRGSPMILEDTTEYMAIGRGMVLRLQGEDYLVTGEAREGRFGISEQPKFWVKYVIDLTTGLRKVAKLVFHEEFASTLGRFPIRCWRSPEKESAVLNIVRGHPRFMQGRTLWDALGNNVRVLDLIPGKTIFSHVVEIRQSHEEYFHRTLPALFRSLVGCVEAIAFLNARGFQHGDIRNDHLLIEEPGGLLRWIDFDYHVDYPDYDLWSVGNLLTYTVGKGIHSMRRVELDGSRYPLKRAALEPEDAMLFYPYRVANLQKLFPYIPDRLNEVLLRFSLGSGPFYPDFQAQVDELREALTCLPDGAES